MAVMVGENIENEVENQCNRNFMESESSIKSITSRFLVMEDRDLEMAIF